MNLEQQNREEEIFLRALELAPGEARAAWLEEACGGDSDRRLSVEQLLEAHEEPASLLNVTPCGLGIRRRRFVQLIGLPPVVLDHGPIVQLRQLRLLGLGQCGPQLLAKLGHL